MVHYRDFYIEYKPIEIKQEPLNPLTDKDISILQRTGIVNQNEDSSITNEEEEELLNLVNDDVDYESFNPDYRVFEDQIFERKRSNGNIVKVKGLYCDRYLKPNLEFARQMTRQEMDNVLIISGGEGCTTGEGQIRIRRGESTRIYTIKELYNLFHGNPDKLPYKKGLNLNIPSYIRSYNGDRIQCHKILNVLYSGVKETWNLILESGKKIGLTENHEVMTIDGFKPLKDLQIGDLIMCDTPKANGSNYKKKKSVDIKITYMKYHKYNNVKEAIEAHRLIYEAHMNNLSLEKYMTILATDEEKSKTLKFINPKEYVIHHKDHNHYNNDLDNLICLNKSDHYKIHLNDDGLPHYRFNQGVPQFEKVKSIEYRGFEDTYDIKCDDPYHNFCCNDIVISNSGKSTFAEFIAHYFDRDFKGEKAIINTVFTGEQLLECIDKTPYGSSIICDESILFSYSQDSGNSLQNTIIKKFTLIRKRMLTIILVLPSPFMLRKFFVLHRCRYLIHVYVRPNKSGKGISRGFFKFYDKERLAKLIILGQKMMDYSVVEPNFRGCWTNTKGMFRDPILYEKKKDDAIAQLNEMQTNRKLLRPSDQVKRANENMYKFCFMAHHYYNKCMPNPSIENFGALATKMGIYYKPTMFKKLINLGKEYSIIHAEKVIEAKNRNQSTILSDYVDESLNFIAENHEKIKDIEEKEKKNNPDNKIDYAGEYKKKKDNDMIDESAF